MSTSAIVVAHPGHELRVFHWMERTQPLYCCLTEGSGGAASSRMPSTDAVLARVGSRRRPALRPLCRQGDLPLPARTGASTSSSTSSKSWRICSWRRASTPSPATPSKASTRRTTSAASSSTAPWRWRAGEARRPIDNRDFVLEGRPDACPEASRAAATWLRLDDAALDRKIDAALQYPELRPEVHAALERFGRGAFAVECLRPVTTAPMLDVFAHRAASLRALRRAARARRALQRDHPLPAARAAGARRDRGRGPRPRRRCRPVALSVRGPARLVRPSRFDPARGVHRRPATRAAVGRSRRRRPLTSCRCPSLATRPAGEPPAVRGYLAWWATHPNPHGAFAARTRWLRLGCPAAGW